MDRKSSEAKDFPSEHSNLIASCKGTAIHIHGKEDHHHKQNLKQTNEIHTNEDPHKNEDEMENRLFLEKEVNGSEKISHIPCEDLVEGSKTFDSYVSTDEDSSVKLQEVPDGGWGWLVAIGCFINMMLAGSLTSCFGILFSQYLLSLRTSSTTTAWIFNIQMCVWYATGPIVRPLTAEFGWRRVGLFGTSLVFFSITISAFSPSAEFLFLTLSLLSGFGGGFVYCVSMVILPFYFKKRLGRANTLLMSGLCAGQIVVPPLARHLQDEYGFRGATIIYGAFLSHGFVAISLFHPAEWHMRKRFQRKGKDRCQENINSLVKTKWNSVSDGKKDETILATSTAIPKKNMSLQHQPSKDATLQLHSNISPKKKINLQRQPGSCEILQLPSNMSLKRKINLQRQPGSGELLQLTSNMSLRCSSLPVLSLGKLSLSSATTATIRDRSSTEEVSQNEDHHILKMVIRVFRSTLSDLKILRSRRSLIINIGIALCINGFVNYLMMVPFFMKSIGYSLQDSAMCIASFGILNLMTRAVVSPLSDWAKFNMTFCFVAGYATMAVSMFAVPLLRNLLLLKVAVGMIGAGTGLSMTFNQLITIKYMGVKDLPQNVGAAGLLIGLGFLIFGPLTGLVRDLSGSYAISLWMLSAILFCCIVLWCFMPAAVRYDAARDSKQQQHKEQI